jgi:hypothetical protein
MATFNLAANQNFQDPAFSTRTGNDVYNLNGFTLTIDTDTRYCANATATTGNIGSVTVSATLGGNLLVDGRGVYLIPFTGGSGTVPAIGTTITQPSPNGSFAYLLGVWSALNVAPTAAGGAMPASGFIKVKQKTGTFVSGNALGNITATQSSAERRGWIEVVGVEAATITANRLGTVQMLGEWFELGTTSGVANQTFQAPASLANTYYAGCFIEQNAGAGDFEFYPCAGSATTIATDIRAKVCWISTQGLVRLGHNGTANAGYTPPAGLRVVVPNIVTINVTSAAMGTNVVPNATLATRYDFTTTGGGAITIDKANLAWFPSFAQAYSVQITNTGIHEQLNISECASPITLTNVGVGQTAAQTQAAYLITLCFAGGTFTNCVWTRYSLPSSGNAVAGFTDCSGFTMINCKYHPMLVKANAGANSISDIRSQNLTYTNPIIVGGKMLFTTCSGITITNTHFADKITGTTATTSTENNYVWELTTATTNVSISGLDFLGLTNVHPYLGLLSVLAASCGNIKLRNIGTRAAPLSLGSANQTGTVLVFAAGAAASDIKMQRVYVANTRTNLWSLDNSTTRVQIDNCAGDYADVPVASGLNLSARAIAATPTYAASTSVYGTHFFDHFTSATVGRLAILMNEATALTASQVSLANGAGFTSAGGLYMPVIGQTATFEMPYFAKGHTSFQNAAAVMAGGTIANYRFIYQIDTGSGYSAASSELTAAALGTALSGIGAINPATGFKLKLTIKTTTTNATAITSLYVLTNSTAVAQDNLYPLDVLTLQLTGLIAGSDIVILAAGTETERVNVDSNPTTTYNYVYESLENVDIGVFRVGYVPFFVRNYSLPANGGSLPIAQVQDRNYSNP